jgi:hypothetical protein
MRRTITYAIVSFKYHVGQAALGGRELSESGALLPAWQLDLSYPTQLECSTHQAPD